MIIKNINRYKEIIQQIILQDFYLNDGNYKFKLSFNSFDRLKGIKKIAKNTSIRTKESEWYEQRKNSIGKVKCEFLIKIHIV